MPVKKITPKKKSCVPAKKSSSSIIEPKEYVHVLAGLKKLIQETQIKTVIAANVELIKLYWSIGQTIAQKQTESKWGSGIIEKLAQDLQAEFPGIGGFSKLNIFRMQAFYRAYAIVSQAVTQLESSPIFCIPWGHNVVLLHKLKNNDERLWYAEKTIENGWSRTILEIQIESDLYNRKGKAITNFQRTLPPLHSDMTHQSLKDPYVFDFLTLHDEHIERDIEIGESRMTTPGIKVITQKTPGFTQGSFATFYTSISVNRKIGIFKSN